ncbi:hypothetical protein HW115_10535 [Verrucomicrobiaceae bacterium N1E253]|uniref:Uncharacterized protein n=1 Tax=Oceaniferula marina TaxID=2748318 RepID=A0A851GFR9_9BACT|nr:hypothetical protein [Oceaniferula marina]NWK56049.1 hypothetical protein [Oceaniferula marina]
MIKLTMTFLLASSFAVMNVAAEDGGCSGKKKKGCGKKDEATLLVEGCSAKKKDCGKKKGCDKKDEATLLAESCPGKKKKDCGKKKECGKQDEATLV